MTVSSHVSADIDLIGPSLSRLDGRVKVTGAARYAAEHSIPGLVHAVAVQSSIVKGQVQRLETAAASAYPGVLDIVTPANAPRLSFLEANASNRPGQTHLVLQDSAVLYQGQYIAIVIAETFEQARYASSALEIEYSEERSEVHLDRKLSSAFRPERITVIDAPEVDSRRGEPEAAFDGSAVRFDEQYTSAIENHNPMEPHATIAQWFGDDLILIDSTQWVGGTRNMVATHLGIPTERVRVVSPFTGGGFGSKGNPWPHPT